MSICESLFWYGSMKSYMPVSPNLRIIPETAGNFKKCLKKGNKASKQVNKKEPSSHFYLVLACGNSFMFIGII